MAVVALAALNTTLLVQISYAQRDFSTAMSGKDEGQDGWMVGGISCPHRDSSYISKRWQMRTIQGIRILHQCRHPRFSPLQGPLLFMPVAGFYKAIWNFVVIICICAPLFSFASYLEDRLVLAWYARAET